MGRSLQAICTLTLYSTVGEVTDKEITISLSVLNQLYILSSDIAPTRYVI